MVNECKQDGMYLWEDVDQVCRLGVEAHIPQSHPQQRSAELVHKVFRICYLACISQDTVCPSRMVIQEVGDIVCISSDDDPA